MFYFTCFITQLLFLLPLCVVLVKGETDSIQLPFVIASRVSGEWSLDVHSPCEPHTWTGTLNLDNNTSVVQWHQGFPIRFRLDEGTEEATTMDLTGLHVFLDDSAELNSMSYTICEEQTNNLATPNRPIFEKRMENTILSEYKGVFFKNDEIIENACQSGTPSVVIRTIGANTQGIKVSDWRMKESLQYIEFQINVPHLTSGCMGVAEKFSRAPPNDDSMNKVTKKSKRRRTSDSGKTTVSIEGGAETASREGSIVIRLMRRTLPIKSFYERYYPTLLFGGMMIFYRAIYGFTSYRALKKK